MIFDLQFFGSGGSESGIKLAKGGVFTSHFEREMARAHARDELEAQYRGNKIK